MKYIIESTNDGCIEIIQFNDGTTYKKRHAKTETGSKLLGEQFYKQMEKDGICEEIVNEVDRVFDGFLANDFMNIAEME